MDKVDDLNNESEYDKLAGTAALGTAQIPLARHAPGWPTLWRQAAWIRPAASTRLAMSGLESDQALSQTDTTNRAAVQPAR